MSSAGISRNRRGRCTIWLALAGALLAILGVALAQPDEVHIGSKSDPDASLFSYDQKFEQSSYLRNYYVGMSATKRFDQCTRLASSTYLKSNQDWVDIALGGNFTGIGHMGYVVLNQKTMDPKDEMARVSHDFVGRFSIDEKILVVKDHMNETGYFGPGSCAGGCL